MVFHDLEGNLLVEPLTRAEAESVARLARMERGIEFGTVSRDCYRAEKARAAEIRQQGMDELANEVRRRSGVLRQPEVSGYAVVVPPELAAHLNKRGYIAGYHE